MDEYEKANRSPLRVRFEREDVDGILQLTQDDDGSSQGYRNGGAARSSLKKGLSLFFGTFFGLGAAILVLVMVFGNSPAPRQSAPPTNTSIASPTPREAPSSAQGGTATTVQQRPSAWAVHTVVDFLGDDFEEFGYNRDAQHLLGQFDGSIRDPVSNAVNEQLIVDVNWLPPETGHSGQAAEHGMIIFKTNFVSGLSGSQLEHLLQIW